MQTFGEDCCEFCGICMEGSTDRLPQIKRRFGEKCATLSGLLVSNAQKEYGRKGQNTEATRAMRQAVQFFCPNTLAGYYVQEIYIFKLSNLVNALNEFYLDHISERSLKESASYQTNDPKQCPNGLSFFA